MKKPTIPKQALITNRTHTGKPDADAKRRQFEVELTELRRQGQFDAACQRLAALVAQNPAAKPYADYMLTAHDPVWWSMPAGRRARLRRRGPSDLAFIRRIWKPEFLRRFNPLSVPLPADDAALTRVLENEFSSLWMQSGYLHWTIETLAGHPFGIVSVTSMALAHRRVELLVGVVAPPYTAAAIEATLLAIDFIFGPMKMHKICSLIAPDNYASLESAKHLGFRVEGVLREHIYNPIAARFADLTHCALISGDPDAKGAQARIRSRLL